MLDPNDIKTIIAVVEPQIRALLNRYQISFPDGEDILQEALLATLLRWEEIENKEGWLLITVRNLCCTHQRKQKCWSRIIQTTDTECFQGSANILTPPQTQTEIAQDLKKLLTEIGKRERYLLYLKYFEDLGPTELGSRIGCHPANVRKITLRAMERLQIAAAIDISPRYKKESKNLK
jgi:RNA polymerase sigma factor (sigma-70 family)